MPLYHSHDKHKQTNKQISKHTNREAIGLKPGTTWSQVEHSTTEPMGKEGLIHEFGSFHKGNKLMLRQAYICERPY